MCAPFTPRLCSFPQDTCRKTQQVCGHNGETYNTVCDAFSDRVTVDYMGSCHAVGPLSDAAPDSACSVIPCPPLSSPGCRPVTPPGQWNVVQCRARQPFLQVLSRVAPLHVRLIFLCFVGACCPICASMLQILWNKELMNTFSNVWKVFLFFVFCFLGFLLLLAKKLPQEHGA